MTMTVKIGWTKGSDFWTFKPEAERHWIEFEISGGFHEVDNERIAEAAFEATNSPGPLSPLAEFIRMEIEATGYEGREAGHFSLSVGDVVQIGAVLLACERFGWTEVEYQGAKGIHGAESEEERQAFLTKYEEEYR